ncbi:hypothetical protein F5051DRAFT_488287 [Lentinula edodes]|nr:hypothetical protein F5051DRAFT_488287 [Lentinula edodes]
MSSRSSTRPKYSSLNSGFSDLTVHGDDDAEKGYMDPPQPRPHLRKKMNPLLDIMRWTCLFAHVSLIVLLIVLIALQQELRSEPISDSYAEFVVWEVFSEIDGYIITGWIIVLTLTTQRLALRRQLNLTNSVTAKHDANEAWMGTGAAILTSLKWRQHGFKKSIQSIFYPLAYLSALSAFHSSATGIIQTVLEPGRSFTFQSQGIPNFTASLQNEYVGADSLMTMFSLNTFDFTGLANKGVGVIYETPIHHHAREFDDVPGYTHLHVNATYFDVTCGSLSGSVRDIDREPVFVFADDFGLENTLLPGNINTFPHTISQNGLYLRAAPWGPLTQGLDATDPKYSWPSSILIFTTVPVFDSSNMAVEPVTVIEPMTYTPFNSQTNSTTTHVSALACNLTMDMSSIKADVDPIDNSLLKLHGQGNKTSANLSPFPSTYRSTPVDMHSSPEDALLAIWSLLTYTAVSPLNQQLFMNCTTSGNSKLACGTLYESEQFVMESLNIFPDILLPGPSATSIQLVDLENTLSRMTAIEFWAEGQGINSKFSNRLFGGNGGKSEVFVVNENTQWIRGDGFIYALIPYNLWISLGLAIFIFALALPSLLDKNTLEIDSIGILQMIWLVSNHPDQKVITQIPEPTTKILRKAGLEIEENYREW